MIVKSTGLISDKLISSKNSLNFSYALYLKLRKDGMQETETHRFVKKWLVMSLLIGRYSGSAESMIDEDIKQIEEKGIENYLRHMELVHLGAGFWDYTLVSDLETSSINNNAYNVYLGAQCNNNSTAFLSKSMKISSLIEQRGDIHHIFPKKYLVKNGLTPKEYNQVANFVFTEQATNIKVGAMAPIDYMAKVKTEINSGTTNLSTIDSESILSENLNNNDIPLSLENSEHNDYENFLTERRKMMAKKIKNYYENL
jgi:hypothetical protein